MKFLGQAQLYNEAHTSGARVKGWNLAAFGGPKVFLGPETMPFPTGTVDRGKLRLDLLTGQVWELESGDEPPSLGPTGVAVGAFARLAKLAPLLVAGLALYWFRGKGR